MIEYLFENEEELHQLPTRVLNTWVNIGGWGFKRQHEVLRFQRKEKQAVKTLQDEVAELRAIIMALIRTNGLQLPDPEEISPAG
jgi:ribonuclease HI